MTFIIIYTTIVIFSQLEILRKKKGETTLLVPKVYLLSAIGPWSLNWTLLIPKVYKVSFIDPSINFR